MTIAFEYGARYALEFTVEAGDGPASFDDTTSIVATFYNTSDQGEETVNCTITDSVARKFEVLWAQDQLEIGFWKARVLATQSNGGYLADRDRRHQSAGLA